MNDSQARSEPSYSDLRILFFCWKLRQHLSCEGSIWSFPSEPLFTVGFAKIKQLVQRGWIARRNRYESELHDDYSITLAGVQVIRDRELDYYRQMENTVDNQIGWTNSTSQTTLSESSKPSVPLPDSQGIWLLRRDAYNLMTEHRAEESQE